MQLEAVIFSTASRTLLSIPFQSCEALEVLPLMGLLPNERLTTRGFLTAWTGVSGNGASNSMPGSGTELTSDTGFSSCEIIKVMSDAGYVKDHNGITDQRGGARTSEQKDLTGTEDRAEDDLSSACKCCGTNTPHGQDSCSRAAAPDLSKCWFCGLPPFPEADNWCEHRARSKLHGRLEPAVKLMRRASIYEMQHLALRACLLLHRGQTVRSFDKGHLVQSGFRKAF